MAQNKERIKVLLTLDVDIETGESVCVGREIINDDLKKPKKSSESTKKSKQGKEEDPNPRIVLEENKYILNSAAAELLQVEPDDRLDIKYEKQGKGLIPVIGTNESFGTKGGNKLTKGMSVSCRGKANEELSKYGSEFSIIPHPNKEGLFILCGDKHPNPAPEVEDDKVVIEDLPEEKLDINLDELTGSLDSEVKEISAFDFNMND